MPFFVDATRAPAVLRITIVDEWPSVEEQHVWRKTAIESGILAKDTRALIDLRSLRRFPMYAEMTRVVESAIRDGGWPLQRAYLATPGLPYGIARQIQLLVADRITIEIFTDEQSAEDWLTGQPR